MSDNLSNQNWSTDKVIIKKMKKTIDSELGLGTWEKLTEDKEPKAGMSDEELSVSTSILTKNFDKKYNQCTANKIFSQVRHGLTKEDFKWAREKFMHYNDIDTFAAAILKDSMDELKGYVDSDELFYGQSITEEVYKFLEPIDDLFYGKRQNDTIVCTAIPFRTEEYLHTDDDKLKRYYMCHCQFARESIRSDWPVSKSLCYCSLGHMLMFWETVLDTKLEGTVPESALKGDYGCTFVIKLPKEILEKYASDN